MPKTQPYVRTIKGEEFAKDIRAGMTDLEMGEKYNLMVYDFDRVLEFLVDAGLITKGEQLERQHLSDCQILRAFVESSEDIKNIPKYADSRSRTRVIGIPGEKQAKVRRGHQSRGNDPVKPRGAVL